MKPLIDINRLSEEEREAVIAFARENIRLAAEYGSTPFLSGRQSALDILFGMQQFT